LKEEERGSILKEGEVEVREVTRVKDRKEEETTQLDISKDILIRGS
jgi:hypothetical protein